MTWITAAADAMSYRSMYALAIEIEASEIAPDRVRRSARRVIRVLQEIIDLPIADARVLARARKRFGELSKALEAGVSETAKPEPRKSPGRESDRAMAIV